MKLVKKVLTGVAVAAMAASGNAAMQTIGGVNWDPAALTDFIGASDSAYQTTTSTGIPSGYGLITAINGLNNFCSGCELTYTFSGFTSAGAPQTVLGRTIVPLIGGIFNIYVDYSKDGTADGSLNETTAGNGTLWLSMVGHTIPDGYSLAGSFNANLLPSDNTNNLTGVGYLDVVLGPTGGLAAAAFNSNTKLDGADFALTSGFTKNADNGTYADLASFKVGTASFSGDSIQIPEPGSLALVGLGLLGLAASRRRKSV